MDHLIYPKHFLRSYAARIAFLCSERAQFATEEEIGVQMDAADAPPSHDNETDPPSSDAKIP
jgi:hypothetical protein